MTHRSSVLLSPLTVIALCLVSVFTSWTQQDKSPPKAAYPIQDSPITIAVSRVGMFAAGNSWYLSVNSAGQAELTIDSYPEDSRRGFRVSTEQMAELRQALSDERFFDLNNEYGQHVFDSSETTITITAGRHSKTVRLLFLMNWANHEPWKLKEPARAVRVLSVIRDWFNDSAAVDLRRYDRMVIEASVAVSP